MKLPTALHYFSETAPADVLSRCVKCKSDDVFAFDGDLFCNPCGWNSIEARVESQLSEMTAKHRKASAKTQAGPDALVEEKAAATVSNPETFTEANVA